jgi:uncharacterized protein YkwD
MSNNINNFHLILLVSCSFIVAIVLIAFLNTSVFATTNGEPSTFLPLISKPENTPTHTPVPTNTPIPTPNPDEDWLGYVNFIRSIANLRSVSSNDLWSDGCWLHSRYMIKNDEISHSEDPSKPWYTTAGDEAAGYSNVMVSSSTNSTDNYAINLWMSGPFHGVAILDPQLEVAGFGSYREDIGRWKMGACLDVSRGRSSMEPPPGTYPVMWPGNGQSTTILNYRGTEWPDPLSSCPGITADYWNPSGPPIYLQIGSGENTPNVTATSLKLGSENLEHCVINETNYVNPSNSTQNTGRWILNTRDAIIIMPKYPLEPGKTYSVSITTNGTKYDWSFSTDSNMQPDQVLPDFLMKAR